MKPLIYKGSNLYAKVRYNIQHHESDLRWRLFIKDGDKEEIMILCKHINIYVAGQTYMELIDGVGHYSLIYKAEKGIKIDKDYIGWIQ